jgi:Leucine-rich repeat (LRR) protein
VVLKLQQQGVAVYPVSKTSNYLSVSFVAVPELDQNIIALLRSISKQVLWLKMPGVKLDDAVVKAVASCSNLRRLSIEHTGVTDVQLEILNNLTSLRYLNIADNKISFGGLQKLNQLKQVKQLYLFQTQVLQTDVPKLRQLFPSASIDLGNYKVETLLTDTQVLRVVKG